MGQQRPRDAPDLLPPPPARRPQRREALRGRPAADARARSGPTPGSASTSGSDIALANAIGREIIASGLEDEAFIARATEGYEAYRTSVEPYTLEYAERETGVPADAIREIAHAFATAKRAMICWTLGITEHHNAIDNVLALINLVLLTGHVGRYGSGVNPLRGQNNVQGGGDMGALPEPAARLPARRERRAPREVRRGMGRRGPAPPRLDAVGDVRRDGARRAPRRSTSSARTRSSPRPTRSGPSTCSRAATSSSSRTSS